MSLYVKYNNNYLGHYSLVRLFRLASAVGLLVIMRLGFAVGLCMLAWLVLLITLFGLVGCCVMCFLG